MIDLSVAFLPGVKVLDPLATQRLRKMSAEKLPDSAFKR